MFHIVGMLLNEHLNKVVVGVIGHNIQAMGFLNNWMRESVLEKEPECRGELEYKKIFKCAYDKLQTSRNCRQRSKGEGYKEVKGNSNLWYICTFYWLPQWNFLLNKIKKIPTLLLSGFPGAFITAESKSRKIINGRNTAHLLISFI